MRTDGEIPTKGESTSESKAAGRRFQAVDFLGEQSVNELEDASSSNNSSQARKKFD